jgi:integrase/recombinase XerD
MRMREELVRRSFSASVTRTYLHAVKAFQQWVDKPLEEAGPDDLRRYHVHLIEEGRLANATIVLRISALRFLYIRVLKRREMKEDLPYPKRQKKLPVVLSPEEVGRLIGAETARLRRSLSRRALPINANDFPRACPGSSFSWEHVCSHSRTTS